MTAAELKAVQLASGLSQQEFARRLGLNPRTFRRQLSGEIDVTRRTEAAILSLFGAREDALSPGAFPRDEWILGDGASGREYLVHARAPRFIARVVETDDDGAAAATEAPADVLSGVVYSGDGFVLAEIVWIDTPPSSPAALAALMDAAADAVEDGGAD